MNQFLNTNEVAAILDRPADSIRTSLCRDGSVAGIVPLKQDNGRLRWPATEVLKVRDSASRGRRTLEQSV